VDAFIQQPSEAQGYRVAAHAMLAGARPLSKVTPVPFIALTLLCGHGVEVALKALLAQSGMSAEILRDKYGHDLLKLWNKAEAHGFTLPTPRPQWIEQLYRVYGREDSYPGRHVLRYPLGIHGIVLPDQSAMLQGFEQLVSMVDTVVT
jgi:hypothetical protein